jgi:hypothetical protein
VTTDNRSGRPQAAGEQVLLCTVRWLERAVIGLNLCPFAKGVHVRGQILYVISRARDSEGLLRDLRSALEQLQAASAQEWETSLLIAPDCMQDFLEFNDFLDRADEVLCELELEGVLQIASFHPRFQFAGTTDSDIGNYTNRAPYPILHLLREESIDRAVQSFPQASEIFEKNLLVLESLGHEGWNALGLGDPATACAGPA